jgi:hypothetical protein
MRNAVCENTTNVPPRSGGNQVTSMHTHFTSNTGSIQRRSRTFWLLCWFLAALYLIASGRAFIPGICATQRALDAQQARESDSPRMHALRPCCVLPPAHDAESGAPAVPRESGCALCKLVSSPAPLAVKVILPVPPRPVYAVPQSAEAQRAGSHLARSFPTRAPPVATHTS